jgi:hypothetical protein
VGSDGGAFAYGDAPFEGSKAGHGDGVAIAATPSGQGYVMTGVGGYVTAYGDAQLFGGLNDVQTTSQFARVVSILETPDGRGYWLASADGGVFAFGDAPFFGSMGATPLNAPVVGMTTSPDGHGYWLVASDGGVFAFGDADFHGSEGGTILNSPVVGIASDKAGNGYWLAAGDGGVFTFGDAPFEGSAGASPLPHPVTAIAATPDGAGYWLATSVVGPSPPSSEPLVDASCYAPAPRPENIVLDCAGYRMILNSLQWSSWTATSATATGGYEYNTCVPYCAVGPTVNVPAFVRLDAPVSTSLGVEFSRIMWTYANAAAPGGQVTETETLFTDP